MKKTLRINTGFITNSSSVVHHFPQELWEHPEVQALAKTYGLDTEGYIGKDLWNRARCESVAITQEEAICRKVKLSGKLDGSSHHCLPVESKDYEGFAAKQRSHHGNS